MAKQRYRVNGKFASLKTFVKTYGLDAVNYTTLDKKDQRVIRGIETYQKRAVLKDGTFAPKTLTENPTVKKFLQSRGESLQSYLKAHEDDLLKFTNQGLFNRTVNTNSLHEFIKNHKGDITIKGKAISKEEFLFQMDMQRGKDMGKGNTVETLYNFNVKNNGRTLNLESKKLIKSPKKKGRGSDATDTKSGV